MTSAWQMALLLYFTIMSEKSSLIQNVEIQF